MNHGRQLRLFLADGTSSGPRFYEIVNRTIQAVEIPANRIKDLVNGSWEEAQKPGVYLVLGTTESGGERLYIGKGENVAKRVQVHPEKLDLEVTKLLLFTSKDENLNGSQVGWLESHLVSTVKETKRISLENKQEPVYPVLSKAEMAIVSEFFEDLTLIAQTAGFDYFVAPTPGVKLTQSKEDTTPQPTPTSPEFEFHQPTKELIARGYMDDEGFVVKAGSDARAQRNPGFVGSYADLHQSLIDKEVLIEKQDYPDLMTFSIDYAFKAPSAAASVVAGNNMNGRKYWKTTDDLTLGDYLDSLTKDVDLGAPESPVPESPTDH